MEELEVLQAELTRTKKALEIATYGLAQIEVTSRGMSMEGKVATYTLVSIKKELSQ